MKPGDPSPLLSLAEEDQQKLLVDEIASLKQEIMLKEEKLRKLKLAELYSKKVMMHRSQGKLIDILKEIDSVEGKHSLVFAKKFFLLFSLF